MKVQRDLVAKCGYTVFCVLLSITIHHYCYFEPSQPEDGTPKVIIFARKMTNRITENLYRFTTFSEISRQDEIDNDEDVNDAKVETEGDEEIKNIKVEEEKSKAEQEKRKQIVEIRDFRSFLVNHAYEKGEYEKLAAYFSDNFDKKRGYLMLAIADKNYADFTKNFAMRVTQLKLKMAFICLDNDVQLHLARVGHTCHLVKLANNEIDKEGNGNVYSKNYISITNLKTLFTATALFAGFRTLQTDVDISFFKDPAPYLHLDGSTDALVSLDREMANSGFDLIASNHNTKLWYSRCWNQFKKFPEGRHQVIWNTQMKEMENKGHLKVISLSVEQFPCGAFFFQTDRREFAGDARSECEECVAVHNNYLGTPQAKRYRMRENGLWLVPRPDTHRLLYLAVTWVWDYGTGEIDVSTAQRRGLTHALRLADSLGRTLLLPRFRCCPYAEDKPVDSNASKKPKKPLTGTAKDMKRCANELAQCSLLHVLDIAAFEEHVGQDGYRENTYLLKKLDKLKVSTVMYEKEIPKDHDKYDVLNVKWRMDKIEKITRIKGQVNDLSEIKYSTKSYEQFKDEDLL